MWIVLFYARLLPFTSKSSWHDPASLPLRGLHPILYFPFDSSGCWRDTVEERGGGSVPCFLVGPVAHVTSSVQDTQWCSPLACQFRCQPWSTCTPAGGFIALCAFPCSPASTQWRWTFLVQVTQQTSAIPWVMSPVSPAKSGAYFWGPFFLTCSFPGDFPPTTGNP